MIKATASISSKFILILLRNLLFSLLFLTLLLFFWLKHGISIEKLHVGPIKIDRLYIELDKKFTLTSEKIVIEKEKEEGGLGDIERRVKKLKSMLSFFELIRLDEVAFENNSVKVGFAEQSLYVESNEHTLISKFEQKNKEIVIEVVEFYFKEFNATLQGEVTYNTQTKNIYVQGTATHLDMVSKFNATKEKETVKIQAQTNTFTQLKPLIKHFGLSKETNEWITKRVIAKAYRLKDVEVELRIAKDNSIHFDFDALHATLDVGDAKILFDKNLPTVDTNGIQVMYKKRNLHFHLTNPRYQSRELSKADVRIEGLGKPKTYLFLDLALRSVLDDKVQKILKVYEVDAPVFSKTPAKIAVALRIPLETDDTTRLNVEVSLDKPDTLHYGAMKLGISKAHATYSSKEKLNFTLDLAKSVTIGSVEIPLHSGKLIHTKDKGTLKVKKALLKDLKGYSNLVALVNTLPALTLLQNPGFSEKGYKINEGSASYMLKGKSGVKVEKLALKGNSSSVVGKGHFDYGKKTVDMVFGIQTARVLGKVIGSLPLLGYILLGDDESVTIGVKYSGKLEDPTVETSTAQDILLLPFEILGRTLKAAPKALQKSDNNNNTSELDAIEKQFTKPSKEPKEVVDVQQNGGGCLGD